MPQHPFAAEHDELARIDFLLDQLARAVERGEVPLESYQLMAPRYLARREDLVAIVTGANRAPSVAAAPASGAANAPSVEPLTGQQAFDRYVVQSPARPVRPTRESKPVEWTTILTFLGAFLVVVASAIFAVAVWDVIGVAGKLGLMGVMTALFYGAGAYARRIGLTAGGTALTAVGSAMLLFEGWIAIDGYNLEGPLPWAAVLLICSVVYWYTEVRLAGRFFGVIGAAAQAGWWWLLGAGLGWPVPVRLAGLAVVVLVWQLAAERGRDNETVGSLARVLEWIAPIASGLLSIGVLVDLALVGTAGTTEFACAAVIAACTGVVLYRSHISEPAVRPYLAALAQVPLFVVAAVSWSDAGDGWWYVIVLALMALTYDLIALFLAGIPFAVIGLFAEAALVLELCRVLEFSDTVTVLAMTALAVAWGFGSRISRREGLEEFSRGAAGVGLVAQVGSFLLMMLLSISSLVISDSIALSGSALSSHDAVLALIALTGWYVLAGVLRDGVVAFAGSLWSFYALAALMSWKLPNQRPEVYAVALIGLAGVWIASASPLEERYGRLWAGATRICGRVAVGVIAAFATLLVFAEGLDGSLAPCVPLLAAALVWALDAALLGSRVTAGLAGLAVFFSAAAALASLSATPRETLIVLSLIAFGLGALAVTPLGSREGRLGATALELALAGLAGHVFVVFLGVVGRAIGESGAWYALDAYAVAAALAVLGAHGIVQSARREFEPGYYASGLMLVFAAWVLLGELNVGWIELFTTPLAVYLVVSGYVHTYVSPLSEFPVATDIGAVLVGLGMPLVVALTASGSDVWVHVAWIFVLSLTAIFGGIAAKSRWYFFGGIVAIVLIVLYRSFSVLAEVWWLALGLVGVAMLVIALTWERQRMLMADTREMLRRSFEGWR